MGFGDLDDAIDVLDIWQCAHVEIPVQLDLEQTAQEF